ncbi:glycosyltransferase [Marinilabilia sp.]
MKRIIITTSNNLVFDNRVHKITLSLIKLGFGVLKTGRNYPEIKPTIKRPGSEKLFNLPFKTGPLFYLFLNIYTFFYLLNQKFDLIWAVDMDTLPAARMAGISKRKPVVFDSHEYFSESPELKERKLVKNIWRYLEKKFIPGSDLFFTVSPGLVKLYKENLGIKFTLLRNLPLKNQYYQPPLLNSDSSPTILYQGSLNLGRGIAQTIEAMKFLPGYKFIIVGRGDCTSELMALTKRLQLQNQVEFVGAVPFEELPNYQQGVLLGMCIHENIGLNYYYALPNRLFDYMQAGIPVLCNGFPDMKEIVLNHNTGLITDDIEPKLLAKKIKKACEDIHLREQWQKSVTEAAQLYTWENEEQVIGKIQDLVHQE